jgi:hypothetical protein
VLNLRGTEPFFGVRKLVLGEKLWEEKGKAIGFSIKSIGPEGVHMEETFTSVTKGFGPVPNSTNVGTLDLVQAPDGSIAGTGQGISTTQDGDTVTWKMYFLGRSEGGKGRTFGIIRFWTSSQKLAWVNKSIAALEGITDTKTMEFSATGYEWK